MSKSKQDVLDMIDKKIAKRKGYVQHDTSIESVRKHVFDLLRWSDKQFLKDKNNSSRQFSLAGRLNIFESRIKSIDKHIRYDINYNLDTGVLEGVDIIWSNKMKRDNPQLNDKDVFRIEDVLFEDLGL